MLFSNAYPTCCGNWAIVNAMQGQLLKTSASTSIHVPNAKSGASSKNTTAPHCSRCFYFNTLWTIVSSKNPSHLKESYEGRWIKSRNDTTHREINFKNHKKSMVLHGYDFRFIFSHSQSFWRLACNTLHQQPIGQNDLVSECPGVICETNALKDDNKNHNADNCQPTAIAIKTPYTEGIKWIYLDGWRFLFFFSPRHRTCWIRPHLQHHLSVATHASHVAIPHVSYEDCGSLAMRKSEGSDLVSWCIIKKYQVIGQNMLFLPIFFMFFVFFLCTSSSSFFIFFSSCWWFQPIWKIYVKIGLFPKYGWK